MPESKKELKAQKAVGTTAPRWITADVVIPTRYSVDLLVESISSEDATARAEKFLKTEEGRKLALERLRDFYENHPVFDELSEDILGQLVGINPATLKFENCSALDDSFEEDEVETDVRIDDK